MMRYRACKVPSNLARGIKSRWWYNYPNYWWNWYYPNYWNVANNVIDSQIQDAQQQIVNTGIMNDNIQNQTLTQIRELQPLK